MSSPAPRSTLAPVLAGPAGVGVVSAYLHGSHTTARHHRESDVDLGILLRFDAFPTSRDRFEAGLRLRAALQPGLGATELDLQVLNDLPPSFAAAVMTTGERIYCSDHEADHAFRRDSQLRAADLAPFLRRTAALKREAIRR